MKKKRVMLATSYQPNDTTSMLRAWGPFSLLQKEGFCEIVQRPKENSDWFKDWTFWFDVDVCYIHRPGTQFFIHLINAAKMHGVPVWVDHDDDLINITPDNPVYFSYAGAGDHNKEATEFSYREADILTCSGESMYKDFLEKYGRSTENTFHIDTALDDRLVKLKKEFNPNNKVSWRGSKSHLTDLLFFGPAIHEAMKKYKEKIWYFFGINPFWTEWEADRPEIKWVEGMNLLPFLRAMTHQNASIHMVPLVDTKFNRVKSNLAWLDATLSGSVVIAPNMEHWNRPGIPFHFESNNVKSFLNRIDEAFYILKTQPETLAVANKLSWEYIMDNLLQSKLNGKRKEILENL